jgi:hypothetical protein
MKSLSSVLLPWREEEVEEGEIPSHYQERIEVRVKFAFSFRAG